MRHFYRSAEAWNAYPHCVTVLVSAYLAPTTFRIEVETLHVDGEIELANPLKLNADDLKKRKIEYLDIRLAHADSAAKDYNAAYDLANVRTSRSPLPADWQKVAVAARAAAAASGAPLPPLMCAYKLVRCTANVFALGGTIKSTVEGQQRNLFNKSHAHAAATVDMWIGLSLEDVRRIEKEAADEAATVAVAADEGGAGGAPANEAKKN